MTEKIPDTEIYLAFIDGAWQFGMKQKGETLLYGDAICVLVDYLEDFIECFECGPEPLLKLVKGGKREEAQCQ
jgi:hypothetical protein